MNLLESEHDTNLSESTKLYQQGVQFFLKNMFTEAIQSFEQCILCNDSVFDEVSRYYIQASLLKYLNPDIKLNGNNPAFQLLMQLREKYFEKKRSGLAITIDESLTFKLSKSWYSTILKFGKYKGSKVCDLITHNPGYILWCINNLTHFFVFPEYFYKESVRKHPLCPQALEKNFLKDRFSSHCRYIENSDFDEVYRVDESDSFIDFLNEEFEDDAEMAYWNLD